MRLRGYETRPGIVIREQRTGESRQSRSGDKAEVSTEAWPNSHLGQTVSCLLKILFLKNNTKSNLNIFYLVNCLEEVL